MGTIDRLWAKRKKCSASTPVQHEGENYHCPPKSLRYGGAILKKSTYVGKVETSGSMRLPRGTSFLGPGGVSPEGGTKGEGGLAVACQERSKTLGRKAFTAVTTIEKQ